jgi:hypothetical protein
MAITATTTAYVKKTKRHNKEDAKTVEGESSAKDLVNLFDYFNKIHIFE